MDPQTVIRNNLGALVRQDDASSDRLTRWAEAYFRFEVTTAASSRAVQRRDLDLFLRFMLAEEGHDHRPAWSPRLSRAFVETLRQELTGTGRRRFGDRTINRVIAHLKTFAKWILSGHYLDRTSRPFSRCTSNPGRLLQLQTACAIPEREHYGGSAAVTLASRKRGNE